MNDLKKKHKLMERCREFIFDYLRDTVPESGIIRSYPVSFDWPGTHHEGMFIIENDYTGPANGRIIRTAMHQNGSDRLVSHYYFSGSNGELAARIRDCDINELIEEFDSLSASVDRMDD